MNEFTPDCERCVDSFHVVQWAMETLDEVRREVWREAYNEAQKLVKQNPRKAGRPKENDPETTAIRKAKAKAEEIKNSAYALRKAPENLTEKQQLRLEMIAQNNDRLKKCFVYFSKSRMLMKLKQLLNDGCGGHPIAGYLLSKSCIKKSNGIKTTF